MRKCKWIWILLTGLVSGALAQFGDPFSVEAFFQDGDVIVQVGVPESHYLYADSFKVTDGLGNALSADVAPETTEITDPNTGKPKPVYAAGFEARYAWVPKKGGEGSAQVLYWGCNDKVCFIPQQKVIPAPEAEPAAVLEKAVEQQPASVEVEWQKTVQVFEVRGSAAGYLNVKDFHAFLDRSKDGLDGRMSGFRLFLSDPQAFVRESGLAWTVLFVLLGGLLLNLTPCVLPMIPINLAIIGAGAQAGSKQRGFLLGGVYGLGIAMVYGGLGLVTVLAGKSFGTLQSSPWFNLVIAVIFLVLALAMFDLFHIDFSRFQNKMGGGKQKNGSYMLALTMGAVAALLAGACVAPVVIAVLLLATNLGTFGLALPFILGLGMALPWPFAGAGLSFLPKPGKWMEYVKYGFGVLIILFALYYANLSLKGFRPEVASVADTESAEGYYRVDGASNEGFEGILARAHESGKPVLIDFWATWCKNCATMEKTTFKDVSVKERLEDYVFVKYAAEDPNNPQTKAVMDYFEVQGLPTFVVLEAK